MRNFVRHIVGCVAVATALSCFAQSNHRPTQQTYEEMAAEPAAVRLAKLFYEADAILVGRVERSRRLTVAAGGALNTEYVLSLNDCLKLGNGCGGIDPRRRDMIRVRPDTGTSVFSSTELRVGGHYILFLCRRRAESFYVLCGNQGIFELNRAGDDWSAKGSGEWPKTDDSISVPSTVPAFNVYEGMGFMEFFNEVESAHQWEFPLNHTNVALLLAQLEKSHALRIIEECKVGFSLTPEIEKELRDVGADEAMLAAIGSARQITSDKSP